LWAKDQGPVVLASNIGGFTEQIHDMENGFLFDVDNQEDLAKKIEYILQLPKEQLDSVRSTAYRKVIKERDFFKNFGSLLNSLWSPS
jgi:glycosyltransferase involved in cell wall biosynthesis